MEAADSSKTEELGTEKLTSERKSTKAKKENEFSLLKNEANILFFQKEDYKAALKKYDEALSKAQNHEELAMIHYKKGQAYETLKKDDESQCHYREAMRLDPHHIKAMTKVAKMCMKIEDYKNAKIYIHQIYFVCKSKGLKIDPSIAELWTKICTTIAEEHSNTILSRFETDGQPVKPLLVEIEEFLNSFTCDPVSTMWKGTVSDPPSENVRSGYKRAVKALKEKNYDAIIDFCCEELKDDDVNVECTKENADVYILRGTFKYLWGYGKSCVNDFLKILNSNDENISKKLRSSAAVKCALYCYRWSEDQNQFLEYTKKAEELWEENSDIYYHTGKQLIELQSSYDAAVVQFKKALKFCPPTESNVLYKVAVYYATFANISPLRYVFGESDNILFLLCEMEPEFQVDECYNMLNQVLHDFRYSICPSDRKTIAILKKIAEIQAKDPRKAVSAIFENIVNAKRVCDPLDPAIGYQLLRIKEEFGPFSAVCYVIGIYEFYKGTGQDQIDMDFALDNTKEAVNICRDAKHLKKYILNLEDMRFHYSLKTALAAVAPGQ